MADYQLLKEAVAAVIKQNGNQEITGDLLQATLLTMINSLGSGYQFAGVADGAVVPGTPDAKLFYIAAGPGVYTNFGGITVNNGELAIFFIPEGYGSWYKQSAQITNSGMFFGGIVGPDSSPAVTDNKTFYIATTPGTYTNFSNLVVAAGELVIFTYSGSAWIANRISSVATTIVNDLTTGGADKALAAEQGKILNYTVKDTNDTLLFHAETGQMFVKGTTFPIIPFVEGGYTTPGRISNFILDIKLKGTPAAGYTYGIGTIHYKHTASPQYYQYVEIVRYTAPDQTAVQVANIRIPSGAPETGKHLYKMTVASASPEITGAMILIDWDALEGMGGKTLQNVQRSGFSFNTSYLFDEKVGYIAAMNVGGEVANVKIDDILVQESKVVYQLANDLDFFTSYFSYKAIGQYTKDFDKPMPFNCVRVNQIRSSDNSSHQIDYKVYLTTKSRLVYRQCPDGVPATNAILLKEGTLTLTPSWADYKIPMGSLITCPAGYKVVVYMVNPDGVSIRMAGVTSGAGNPEKTSNVSLLTTAPVASAFTSSWGHGSLAPDNTGYFNVALTLLVEPMIPTAETVESMIESMVPEAVEDYISDGLVLTIPDTIYAVVDTELNLWNDAVSLSIDRGLSSPMNYQVVWTCAKGLITDRCFRYTPAAADAGSTVACTCAIYNMLNWTLIASKTFNIKVLSKSALNSAKNIVYFGDSLGSGAASALRGDFTNSDKFSGTVPTMLGTKGTGALKYEAVGGYSWRDYATVGRRAFRCTVTGVGAIALNSRYTNNGFTWTVVEVNLVEGNGNILITKEDVSGTDAPQTNGTLVPVDTGDSIPYTNATLEGANPLWNDQTNELDIAAYKGLIGLQSTDKIDAVSFQFGINDHALANNLTTLKGYIDALYNAFMADNPNTIFIIGLTTSSGNDVNGSGANYGARNDWMQYLRDVYKIRQFYLSLLADVNYPNLRIAPIHLEVDRYYGYAFSSRPISQRTSATVDYHNNYVHPGSDGYGQMGDAYFAAYIGFLTE